MNKQIRDFLEDDRKAKQMYYGRLPLKKRNKKARVQRMHLAQSTVPLNRSVSPYTNSKVYSQREIDKKYKDLLMFTKKDEYSDFKRSKFDEGQFEKWRTQNISRQELLKQGLTKKKHHFER
jgi:hypothetical protein